MRLTLPGGEQRSWGPEGASDVVRGPLVEGIGLEAGTLFEAELGRSLYHEARSVALHSENERLVRTLKEAREQIVTLTYPHIGNCGANAEDVESARVQAAGLVVPPPNGNPP